MKSVINYWLMKSEPSVFSIDDLEKNTKKYGEEIWDGVRNYQARNFLREMQQGDLALFYHSNTEIPGIYGLMEVLRTGVVDPTQFDPQSKYFDPKSTKENPRWDTVSVIFLEKWKEAISLSELKQRFEGRDFATVKRGNRLSVMPVAEEIYREILADRKL